MSESIQTKSFTMMELELQNPRVISAGGNSNFWPVFVVISLYGKCSRMSVYYVLHFLPQQT